MEEVKCWKVELFRDNDRRSGLAGMASPTSPFFTGYSREKPALNLQSDVQPGEYIELYTAPDALESRLFRRHSFDYIHLTPIFESWEKCCDDDEHAKSDADNYLLSKGFKDAASPLIQWLAENVHPHHTAIVTATGAELLMSEQVHNTDKYLKD
ncbi:hypothetical protein ACOY5P_03400 [Enterobacter asburiae]|uniref:hypothetical protein n=1 Tax=Enterobacter cloacae complex TaxID=354276 RepID=UPI002A4F1115|nr:hypothetical protein [Enterobacter hormaechei]